MKGQQLIQTGSKDNKDEKCIMKKRASGVKPYPLTTEYNPNWCITTTIQIKLTNQRQLDLFIYLFIDSKMGLAVPIKLLK